MKEFDDLIAETYDMLFARSMRLTQNRQDAEDLAQDTVVLALRNFESFSPGTNFKAWLLQIQRNALLTKIVRRTRFQNFAERYERHFAAITEPTPDELLMFDEIPEEVWAYVEKLPEAFSTPFIMLEVEDLKVSEISEKLGIPYGTVLSRIHRARLKLKEIVKNAKSS